MKKILIVLAALASLAPASALAAGPADVTVRVEDTGDTLLARSAVHTTTTPVVKDGNNAHSCTGTSVAGALEVATGGNWSGTWSDAFGYSVEVILGESHLFSSDHYWGEFVNGVPGNGACADELSAGDEVLFAPEPTDFSASPDNPMYLSVPATAQRGVAFNVTVNEKVTTFDSSPPFASHTVTQPVQGASVGGATTDANGVAAVTLNATGPVGLRATHTGDIRTATETVCVHDGDDGTCGTAAPGVPAAPAAPCIHDGDDGLCGTPDHKATYGFIKSIREHQHFRKGRGPRELKGTSDPDASGLKDVELRLTRNDRGRCSRFSGTLLRFAQLKRCGASHGTWFSVGSKADWSYLLPKALGRGRYVLDLRTVDGAGNADVTLARTRNRVVFFVG
jgi:hypothetical protein